MSSHSNSSASLLADSHSADSLSTTSFSSGSKKHTLERPFSAVWDHFHNKKKGNGHYSATCIYCEEK